MTYHQRAPCYGTRLDLGAGISYASLPDVFRAKNEKKKTNLGLGSGVAGSSLPDFPQLAAESFDEQSEVKYLVRGRTRRHITKADLWSSFRRVRKLNLTMDIFSALVADIDTAYHGRI